MSSRRRCVVGALVVLAAAVALAGAGAAAAEQPQSVVPVLFQTAEAAAVQSDCRAGHTCPIPGSVCCKSGDVCCRFGCDDSVVPTQCLEHPLVRQAALDKRERAITKKETLVANGEDLEKCSGKLSDAQKAVKALRRRVKKLASRVRKFRAAGRRRQRRNRRRKANAKRKQRKQRKQRRQSKAARAGKKGKKSKGKKLDVAKLRTFSSAKLVRIIQRMYKQRKWMAARLRKAGVVRRFSSCREIHEKMPKAKTGRYTIRVRRGHLLTVHCDMDVDGGGWTSLLNPLSFPAATVPGLLFEPTTVSGAETCAGSDFVRPFSQWNGIYHYKCGNVVTRSTYQWSNYLNATDVMIRATLQGETERTMSINGRYVGFTGLWTPKADSASKGTCAFYTGEGEWTQETAVNRCASTPVPPTVKPLVLRNWLEPAKPLSLRMQSGRAALPSTSYGTGWNIATLMVR